MRLYSGQRLFQLALVGFASLVGVEGATREAGKCQCRCGPGDVRENGSVLNPWKNQRNARDQSACNGLYRDGEGEMAACTVKGRLVTTESNWVCRWSSASGNSSGSGSSGSSTSSTR